MPNESNSEPDAHDSFRAKVESIFSELVGERARRISATSLPAESVAAIAASYAPDMDSQRAQDIAFHLSDWAGDAAFLIALHLYPDRFTADEIQAGIGAFFVHAPFHIAEAAALAGQYAPSSSEYEADQPNSNDRNA